MVVYLVLDQKQMAQLDFSDQAARDFSGTVYTTEALDVALDISGFTSNSELRFIDPNRDFPVFTTTSDLTLNADGTFTWRPTGTGSSVNAKGWVKVRLQLNSSTERVTAIGVNGSDDLFILKY